MMAVSAAKNRTLLEPPLNPWSRVVLDDNGNKVEVTRNEIIANYHKYRLELHHAIMLTKVKLSFDDLQKIPAKILDIKNMIGVQEWQM